MRAKPIPEEIKDYLSYDPNTGHLRWKQKTGRKGRIGNVAGTPRRDNGYIQVKFLGNYYFAHRIAFTMLSEELPPELYVDHINGDPADNRWCNLRVASNSQNQMNSGVKRTNKLGIKGVFRHQGRYTAKIQINGTQHYLGMFKTKEEAKEAYRIASKQQHGRFARTE